MNQAETNFTSTKSKSIANKTTAASDVVKERIDTMKHTVEDLRERAEDAFREKPYLLPVTAGAVGLGVGLLLGSKVTRFLAIAAVGTFVKQAFGDDIQRITQSLGENLRARLEEGTDEGTGEME